MIDKRQHHRQGGRLRSADIQALIKEMYGVDYTLSGIYNLAHRIGLSWITSRSVHPRVDLVAQESFKKWIFPRGKRSLTFKYWHRYYRNLVWGWTRIGQQGSLTRLWARTGTRPRGVRQQQFMYQSIYGACCPDYNKAAALVLPYANTCAMQEFLEEIPRNVHQDHHALVIMDRAPWHMTGKLHLPTSLCYAFHLTPLNSIHKKVSDEFWKINIYTIGSSIHWMIWRKLPVMPEMILSKLMDLLILFDPENGLNYETYLICLV